MTATSQIAQVVEPLRSDAMKRAEEEAAKIIARVRTELAAAGNDLKVAAPYPSGSTRDFHEKLTRYKLFGALTKWRKVTYSMNEPMLADVSDERVAKFIKEAREDAAAQYDLFIRKLEGKIGATLHAKLEGNHVWGYSYLSVETTAGEKQVWKTHMIINVSKLGKLFNQWPSRKVKAVGS